MKEKLKCPECGEELDKLYINVSSVYKGYYEDNSIITKYRDTQEEIICSQCDNDITRFIYENKVKILR